MKKKFLNIIWFLNYLAKPVTFFRYHLLCFTFPLTSVSNLLCTWWRTNELVSWLRGTLDSWNDYMWLRVICNLYCFAAHHSDSPLARLIHGFVVDFHDSSELRWHEEMIPIEKHSNGLSSKLEIVRLSCDFCDWKYHELKSSGKVVSSKWSVGSFLYDVEVHARAAMLAWNRQIIHLWLSDFVVIRNINNQYYYIIV